MLFLLAGLAVAGVPGDDVDVWSVRGEVGARSGVTEPLTLGVAGRVDQRDGGWVSVETRRLDGIDRDLQVAVESILNAETPDQAGASSETRLAGGWHHLEATRVAGFRGDVGLNLVYRNHRAVFDWAVEEAKIDLVSPDHLFYLGVSGRLGRRLFGDDNHLLTAHVGGGVDMPIGATGLRSSFGDSADDILDSMGVRRMSSLVQPRARVTAQARFVRQRVFVELAPQLTWILPSPTSRRVLSDEVQREYDGRLSVGVMF